MSQFLDLFKVYNTATWNLIRTPIPAISDFVKFGLNPEEYEKS